MQDKIPALREVEMTCVWDYLILNGLLREVGSFDLTVYLNHSLPSPPLL